MENAKHPQKNRVMKNFYIKIKIQKLQRKHQSLIHAKHSGTRSNNLVHYISYYLLLSILMVQQEVLRDSSSLFSTSEQSGLPWGELTAVYCYHTVPPPPS